MVYTVHYSPPDLSLVFFLFCLFVFVVVCFVLLSLVAAAFLANKDVYYNKTSGCVAEQRHDMRRSVLALSTQAPTAVD